MPRRSATSGKGRRQFETDPAAVRATVGKPGGHKVTIRGLSHHDARAIVTLAANRLSDLSKAPSKSPDDETWRERMGGVLDVLGEALVGAVDPAEAARLRGMQAPAARRRSPSAARGG